MKMEHNRLISLDEIPANRHLVEALFANGVITQGTRDYALELLYPVRQWGLWVARLLLALGAALVLSGIVYFFAFNWAVIPPLVKLGSLAGAIVCCIAFVLAYGLERRTGQVMSLAACVLTGVFLAVYGQIYQTGADAYTLFVAWAALIFPWVVVTAFAGLWAVWLVIANVALVLWWDQMVLPPRDMELFIFTLVALMNSVFLALREALRARFSWLEGQWTRLLPVVAVLGCGIVPAFLLILDWKSPPMAAVIGGAIAPFMLAGLFYAYRYRMPDMRPLTLTVLAGCGLIEMAVGRMAFEGEWITVPTLFMGLFSIGLFGAAVLWLRILSLKEGVAA